MGWSCCCLGRTGPAAERETPRLRPASCEVANPREDAALLLRVAAAGMENEELSSVVVAMALVNGLDWDWVHSLFWVGGIGDHVWLAEVNLLGQASPNGPLFLSAYSDNPAHFSPLFFFLVSISEVS